MVFLYTNYKREKEDLKTTIHNVASEIKVFGISLTKDVKALCIENFKTLLQEIIRGNGNKYPAYCLGEMTINDFERH